jgi:hypothetical protein
MPKWKIPHDVQEFLEHCTTVESEDAPVVMVRITAKQRGLLYEASVSIALEKAE